MFVASIPKLSPKMPTVRASERVNGRLSFVFGVHVSLLYATNVTS